MYAVFLYSLLKCVLDSSERPTWFRNFLTRKRRPFTRDDVWAIASWAFVGHGALILVGTTTFASIVLLVANSLQIQGMSCRLLSLL